MAAMFDQSKSLESRDAKMDVAANESLSFTAFLYVLGDLGERETEQFEARLADDLDAAMEVSRAVELLELMSQLPATPSVTLARTAGRRWTTGVAAAIAATATVWLALWWNSVEPQKNIHAPSADHAADLAIAWAEARDLNLKDDALQPGPWELSETVMQSEAESWVSSQDQADSMLANQSIDSDFDVERLLDDGNWISIAVAEMAEKAATEGANNDS